MTANQRRAIAEFLRARRARLTPAEVGLPAGGARRTPGLRREDVAVLAGVSVTWYTWLEQARPINPSSSVLRAIARTLRLSGDETAHLLELAESKAGQPDVAETPTAVRDLVHHQLPNPAVLLDRRWDVVAWNDMAEALWHYSRIPDDERNVAWLMFHPYIREHLADWGEHARRIVSEVRAGSAALADDVRFTAVLRRLLATQPEAARWWTAGEVRRRTGVRKVFDHPEFGCLALDEVVLRPAIAPDLHLSVLLPVRGTDTARRLATLAAPGPLTLALER
jgi:transcriptional regulator with XRE-family HTH domain